MRQAMEQQGLEAGIAQHDFEARAGGGVAGQGRIDLVAQVLEEHRGHYVIVVADRASLARARPVAAQENEHIIARLNGSSMRRELARACAAVRWPVKSDSDLNRKFHA